MSRKAYLVTENNDRIECVFNPPSLTLGATNSWQSDALPGKDVPDLFFGGSAPGTLSTELFFDTTDTGTAVTTYTDKLFALMKVDPSLPGTEKDRNSRRPPWVQFHWGDLHSFKAIIENLNVTFTYFAADGKPLRAKVGLSLKQYQDDAKRRPQNPTSVTPDPHQVHVLQVGETLDRLSARYYGTSTEWRLIATANRIADPVRVRPGTPLAIPRRSALLEDRA